VKYRDVFSDGINLQTLWRILLINTNISAQQVKLCNVYFTDFVLHCIQIEKVTIFRVTLLQNIKIL